ncbi:MAG TPA: LapA family protein [Candidatus Aminicenantes bacterium]|nr:LapA family protein [Candidatus Aminicenantes bacterium]HDT13305.1 LapA family protein [Candidatus Aminicenantes bacterium]
MAKKIALGILLLALVVIVFVQNPGEVSYRIYFWRFTISQMILLPLTLLIGFFLGLFAAGIRKRRP